MRHANNQDRKVETCVVSCDPELIRCSSLSAFCFGSASVQPSVQIFDATVKCTVM